MNVQLTTPLEMPRGPRLPNRMLLAPLTNQQSNSDGTASEADLHWIDLVSAGGHSMVMTCAAHVQSNGIAFPGQLGIFDDRHLPGLIAIADNIRRHGAVSSVQLHHGGVRSLGGVHGEKVGPSDIAELGVRGLSLAEVEGLRDDFIRAAVRAQRAGFDGVEIHGAFGWVITQFLTTLYNHRTDRYGGTLENRSRLLFEIAEGIRQATGDNFQIGLRLSLERYNIKVAEMRDVFIEAIARDAVDYLDIAPWDVDVRTSEPGFEGRRVLEVFTELPRRGIPVGASGGLFSAKRAQAVLDAGCDFVMLARASIGQPNFPLSVARDSAHVLPTPIRRSTLEDHGLSKAFIDYASGYRDFAS